MAVSFRGAHFPQDIILTGVRWYVAYPLSMCDVEELTEERGVEVDHSTMTRWVIKYSPQLAEAFHRRKRPVWMSWRMDETYIKIKGQWRYLYRTVDKTGQIIDFLRTVATHGRNATTASTLTCMPCAPTRRHPGTWWSSQGVAVMPAKTAAQPGSSACKASTSATREAGTSTRPGPAHVWSRQAMARLASTVASTTRALPDARGKPWRMQGYQTGTRVCR
jgi:DDE domain